MSELEGASKTAGFGGGTGLLRAGHSLTCRGVSAGQAECAGQVAREVDTHSLTPESLTVEDHEIGGEITRSWHKGQYAQVSKRGYERAEIRVAWLRAKHLRSGSANTVAAYGRDIGVFFDWCDRERLDTFTLFAPDVENYLVWLMASRGKSTVSRMLTSVSSFYSYAGRHTQGRVTNPVALVERPKVNGRSPTLGLSRDEVDALRAAARGRGDRDYAMVQLLLGTALRVSEMCRANTSDLTRDSGQDVLRVVRKGGGRDSVPLPAAVLRALRRHLDEREGPLFLLDNGSRMTRRMVDYHLSVLTGLAGIEKRISPHSLRHTAATLALDAGATLRDVQVMMRHRSPDTTARYDRARRELDNPASRALAVVVADD